MAVLFRVVRYAELSFNKPPLSKRKTYYTRFDYHLRLPHYQERTQPSQTLPLSPPEAELPIFYARRMELAICFSYQHLNIYYRGYCLQRLRTTITLWSFIRSNVIDHTWKTAPVFAPPLVHSPGSPPPENGIVRPPTPKKKTILQTIPSNPSKVLSVGKLGGLWGALRRSSSAGTVDENKKREFENGEKLSLKEAINSSPPSPALTPPPSQSTASQINSPPPPLPKRDPQAVTSQPLPPPVKIEPSATTTNGVPPDNQTQPPEEVTQVDSTTLSAAPSSRTRGRSGTVSVPPPPSETELVGDSDKHAADDIKEGLMEEPAVVAAEKSVVQDEAFKESELTNTSPEAEIAAQETLTVGESLEPLAATTLSKPEEMPAKEDTVKAKDSVTQLGKKESSQQEATIEATTITAAPALASSAVPPSSQASIENVTPPTTGTGAPPPIPRRAARRAAP
jgi:Rab guanine nucleotide exchange factor SEC2